MSDKFVCAKLPELKVKENRLSVLKELLEHLKSCSNLENKAAARILVSKDIFECADWDATDPDNKKCTSVVIDILNICMKTIHLEKGCLPSLVNRSLGHEDVTIRRMALITVREEVSKKMEKDNVVESDYISLGLLHHLFATVQCHEESLALMAANIIKIMMEPLLDRQEVKDEFLDCLKRNDIVRCRIYEVAVNLALKSETALHNIEFVLDHALSEFDNGDLLVQLNILEILVPLTEKEHGFNYLEKRQVFAVLDRHFEEMNSKSKDRILLAGIIKFFSKICGDQPEKIINSYPHLLKFIFDDFAELYKFRNFIPGVFDILANITQTQEAVLLLEEKYPHEMLKVFESFEKILCYGAPKMVIPALNSLESIFTFAGDVQPSVDTILQSWLKPFIYKDTKLDFVMGYATGLDPDVRIAAYKFASALCTHSWGMEMFKTTPGFFEILVSRHIEMDKEAQLAKYNMVKMLAESGAFDVQRTLQLQTYIKAGPYYEHTYEYSSEEYDFDDDDEEEEQEKKQ